MTAGKAIRSAPVVSTGCLVLRPLERRDAVPLAERLFADPEVTRWLPEQPRTRESQLALGIDYVRALSDPWPLHGHGGWAVCLRRSGDGCAGPLIGYCGFFEADEAAAGPLLPREAGPELGYGLARPHWGSGYATEAARAALRALFALDTVQRVYATCASGNAASRRVLEKIGMRFEGALDLFGSVAAGEGPMPLFTAERQSYLAGCTDSD